MEVCLLESYFKLFYAQEILKKMEKVLMIKCDGCVINSLSQTDHSCLRLSKKEQIKLYFEDILLEVDENEILRNWEHSISQLKGVDEIVGLYRLKLYCRDWRETDMKTLQWKTEMIKMVAQLHALDTRLS
jgi:hypothetical protein